VMLERNGTRVFAQPGFQHRPQSSTNGLARQNNQNATNDEKMTEMPDQISSLP
jgi:hypothetical protein